MDIIFYLFNKSYILIPILYILGTFLKQTPKIQDYLIPWILLGFGIIGGYFLSGMKTEGIFQGILITGVTVLGNQLYKQTAIKRITDKQNTDNNK